MLLPLLGAIGVWFVTAPSHRYCPPLFWSLAALGIAECHRALAPYLTRRSRRLGAAFVAAIAVTPFLVDPRFVTVRDNSTAAAALPAFEGAPDVTVFNTRSGVPINIPARSTAPALQPNACRTAPLPCTPNPAPNLQLRVPGRLEFGFKVEGDWEMLDWPYYWHAFFLPEWRARR